MVALGPFEGCVSESFELDVTKLEVGYILGEFYASDPDAQDTLTYWLRESTWTSQYFHIYNGNKLRVKSIDFDGTSTPFISIEYFVVDSAGLRYPILPTNMIQEFTLRFPLCAAREPFNIDEPLTESIFEVPEYATLNYNAASGIPFSEINNVTGDKLKYRMHGHIETARRTIFRYGPLNIDFSNAKRLPGSYRRSQFNPEYGITHGIRQHNVLVGQGCQGTEGAFFVCGGMSNYIQWNLYPRQLHSDFHVQSLFKFNKSLRETGISFLLWSQGASIEIVIDGKRKRVLVEGSGIFEVYTGNDHVWDGHMPDVLSLFRVIRKNDMLSCYINDLKLFDNLEFTDNVDSIGWKPNNQTLLVSMLSLIKPFKVSCRVSFNVRPGFGMGTTTLLEISLLHGMFEVSERHSGINGQTLHPTVYILLISNSTCILQLGWGVIDSIKLRIGSDNFAFSSLSLSVMSETNAYKKLLAVTNVDVLIENGQWYHTFDPYCVFEDGRSVLFSDLQIVASKQYGSLMLPKKALLVCVKVESDKKALAEEILQDLSFASRYAV